MNSTWLVTSELANQRARKALFTCVIYTNIYYSPSNSYASTQLIETRHLGKYTPAKTAKYSSDISSIFQTAGVAKKNGG